jgi:TolB-like protein/Flp pilus assembly protein TadD
MKRCPECRRDYYDETLLYCLDDGNALLDGPASMDEPATAMLRSTAMPGEAPTRAQIHTTEQTAVLPRGADAEPLESSGDVPEKHSFSANSVAKPLTGLIIAVLILVGGFFGYKYFASTKQIESIAVMPFVNESGNTDIEYLSDGMTETLIRSLSNLANLDVKPRSAVFRYKGKDMDAATIARELSVQAILTGNVVQRGEQLTLNLELVDALKNRVIWSEQYNRNTSDLVTLQSVIAKDVSTKLTAKLSGTEETKVTKAATTDPVAYQAFLKGRYYWNRRTSENLKKAIAEFKIATDRDPNYALAFAGLADCHALLSEYSGVPLTVTSPQAKTFAERAIALDGSLAEPHAALGTVNRQLWQWAEAEREYKRAIELNPNYATAYHWYAIMLQNVGRKDEALTTIQRAHELDPLSSIIMATVTWVQLTRGNYTESIENALRLIELDPNFGIAHDNLGLAYLKTGRHPEALASFEKAAQMTNRWSFVLGNLGYAYATMERRTEALAIITELEEKYSRGEANGFSIATVYAGLGDRDGVFAWLEKDFQNRDGSLADITASVPLEPLRGDPRFKDLLKRMNLPE